MTNPTDKHRETARTIRIPVPCIMESCRTGQSLCSTHLQIATALATTEADAYAHAETLATAIADAAKKAGIYNGEVPLSGPQLIMLCDDLVSAASMAYARGRGEAKAEGKKLYSRLVQLAARIIQHRGFLSPISEDNPASKKVLKVAEHQDEQCRLWAIEAREIADAILASERSLERHEFAPLTGSPDACAFDMESRDAEVHQAPPPEAARVCPDCHHDEMEFDVPSGKCTAPTSNPIVLCGHRCVPPVEAPAIAETPDDLLHFLRLEAENMACSLESVGYGRHVNGRMCTPLERYRKRFPKGTVQTNVEGWWRP